MPSQPALEYTHQFYSLLRRMESFRKAESVYLQRQLADADAQHENLQAQLTEAHLTIENLRTQLTDCEEFCAEVVEELTKAEGQVRLLRRLCYGYPSTDWGYDEEEDPDANDCVHDDIEEQVEVEASGTKAPSNAPATTGQDGPDAPLPRQIVEYLLWCAR